MCQVCGGSLDGLPGLTSLGLQLSLSLALFDARSLSSGVQRCISFRVPLLDALLAHLENFRSCVAQLVGVFGCALFCAGDRLVRIFDGPFSARTAFLEGL